MCLPRFFLISYRGATRVYLHANYTTRERKIYECDFFLFPSCVAWLGLCGCVIELKDDNVHRSFTLGRLNIE